MSSSGFPKVSWQERRERGVTGLLRVSPGEGGTVILEFEPSRAQLRLFRRVTNPGEDLQKHLERLGVPAAYFPKILASRRPWCREMTISPADSLRKEFGGHQK